MDGAYLSNGEVKNVQWKCTKFCSKEDIPSELIPWPARNYTCSFCKREFKSAQALGGHMNVHRRDRARLRLLPSWFPENSYSFPSPNPNPSFSSLSPPLAPPPAFRSNNFLSSPAPSASTVEQQKSVVSSGIVDLELKMGFFEGSDEDLDLELRL